MFGEWTSTLEGKELKAVSEDLSLLHISPRSSACSLHPRTVRGLGRLLIPFVCPSLCLGSAEQTLKPAIHCCLCLAPASCSRRGISDQSFFVPSAAFEASFLMLGVIYVCKEGRWVTCHKSPHRTKEVSLKKYTRYI